ncbi:MAG: hypothetical protein GY731_09975 [Gammaproteobacteria bacterium]|nr:hypothetical protein [Gammaproteobacteria bacterium]
MLQAQELPLAPELLRVPGMLQVQELPLAPELLRVPGMLQVQELPLAPELLRVPGMLQVLEFLQLAPLAGTLPILFSGLFPTPALEQ